MKKNREKVYFMTSLSAKHAFKSPRRVMKLISIIKTLIATINHSGSFVFQVPVNLLDAQMPLVTPIIRYLFCPFAT